MHGELDALHLADQASGHRVAHVAKMRCPPAILIDGQLHAAPLGPCNERRAHIQVEHKRLLAEDVFTSVNGRFEDRQPLLRMGRKVHHFDIVAGEQVPIVEVGVGRGVEFPLPLLDALPIAAAQGCDLIAGVFIGPQVHLGYATAAD